MPFQPTTAIPRPDLVGHVREYVAGIAGFVAPSILPFVTVKERLDSFYKIGPEAMHDLPDDSAGPGGGLKSKSWGFTTDSYRCQKRGFKADITDEDRTQYASVLDLELFRSEENGKILFGNFERTVNAMMVDEAVFPPTGETGVTLGTPWTNAAATPAQAVQSEAYKIFKRTGVVPDQMRLIVPEKAVMGGIPFVTEYFNRMKIDSEALSPVAREKELARYFGVGSVKIAGAVYNSANSGATPVLSTLWNPVYAALLVPTRARPNPSLQVEGLGCTFVWDVWDEFEQGSMLNESGELMSLADVPMRITSERNAHDTDSSSVAHRWWRDPKIQSTKYANLIKGVTA